MPKYKDMTYTIRNDDKRCVKKITLDRKSHFISAKTPQDLYVKYRNILKKYFKEELDISDIKMETWAANWLEIYKKSNEKKTIKNYESIIKLHINPKLGAIKLKDLTQLDIVDLLNDMKEKGITKTRNYTLQTINQILNKAIENNLINRNVALGIKLPAHKAKEKKILPNNIIKKICDLSEENEDAFMFMFLIYTGLRRGELVPLTIKDIDLKNKTITINKAIHYEHNKPEIKGTKTNENRVIPIFDIIYDKLSDLVKKRTDYLFVSSSGTIMSEQSIKRKLEKITKLVNYKFTYHQCRHTFITLMYKADIDVKQAQQWSGHKDITVLLNTYTHLDSQMNKKSIEKMNKSCGKVAKLKEKVS